MGLPSSLSFVASPDSVPLAHRPTTAPPTTGLTSGANPAANGITVAAPNPIPEPQTSADAGLTPSQPILVLGGFLIGAEAYAPMLATLERLSGQPVVLVPVSRCDWLLTVLPLGWARLLDRVAPLAADLAACSPSGRITLVGHSSGGILLRLFLADGPFEGRRYGGRRLADTLVMLGSPHTALKATAMRARVARELPGATFAGSGPDSVRYVAVAGAIDLAEASGQASATARRLAPTAYRNSTGDPADRGDGLVPVASALLEGAEPVVLEGVAHGGTFGPIWYGTQAVVERWWAAVTGGATAAEG